MKTLLKFVILFLFSQMVFSQPTTEKSAMEYTVIKLESEYFPDQQRTIKIYLPQNYSNEKKYPVVYTLDGASLFETTSKYVEQLSKLSIEEDYDYGTDAIPQSIVVGIFHNDRSFETIPNFTKYADGDESKFLEGPEKLKNFVFNDVVSYIDAEYSTSGYNSIIGHSNTAHFVMCLPFQSGNPFNGIISLSLSANSENFKNKVRSYLETNRLANVFIGYGTKDFDFNEFAKTLKRQVLLENLSVEEFNANHNEMPSLAILSGLKFLFRKYRNTEDFETESAKNDFDISRYLQNYRTENNKAYGIDTKMKEDDFYSLIQVSINAKNKGALRQLLDYDSKVNGYETQTHMLFVYHKQIGDFEKAKEFAYKMMHSTDTFENRVLKANLDLYYDFFINDFKDIKMGIDFFEEGKENFKENKLEFSYFIAKASIENSVEKKLGKSSLNYCLKNYGSNRYFTKLDLEKLKKKRLQ